MLSYPSALIVFNLALNFLRSPIACHAWVCQTATSLHPISSPRITTNSLESKSIPSHSYRHGGPRVILSSSTSSAESLSVTSDDDDDEEYEYVEYDILTESEFLGSEWLVGTVMDNKGENIAETWVRLATDKDGKNVAIWGDNSEGNWNFDTANQFLSMSKNSVIGKNIWAGVVDDYYFCRGSVRGWNFFSPASVVGQWQAKRLGVDKDDAGIAPWFEVEDGQDSLPPTENSDGY